MISELFYNPTEVTIVIMFSLHLVELSLSSLLTDSLANVNSSTILGTNDIAPH